MKPRSGWRKISSGLGNEMNEIRGFEDYILENHGWTCWRVDRHEFDGGMGQRLERGGHGDSRFRPRPRRVS